MKRSYPFTSGSPPTDNSPARMPKVSRRVKACTECQARKIKCDLPQQGEGPCARCKRLALECTVNKSLQTLLQDDAGWKNAIEERTKGLQNAIAEILMKLDMPNLDYYGASAVAVKTPMSDEARERQPISSTQQRESAREDTPRHEPGRHPPPMLAMTRENSQEPAEEEETAVAPPMSSLFEVTKLRNIRSNVNQHSKTSRKPSVQSDLISDGKVSLQDAEELFNIFDRSLNHYLWGGVALLHGNLASARKSSTLLTTAILAVTALHMPGKEDFFDICYTEFLSIVSESMFARYHSLDDIRGLCIGAFWLSEISWKLSGHAVRIAMEMNLHLTFSKAMRKSPNFMERARLWYLLYVCDHHFSIAYGRPPMIQEDAAITYHEQFLQHPGMVESDHRLHSQVSLFLIMSRMQQVFGMDNEEPLSDEKFSRLRQFNHDLDGWKANWETRLAPNTYVANYPARGVNLHYHFAKLQLNAMVYRGLKEQSVIQTSSVQQEFGQLAVISATNALNTVLSDNDMRRSVVGVPLYLHTIITFSVVFLLKVHLKWSRFTPCPDPGLLMQHINDSITLLSTAKASQRHLCFYIARGLEGVLAKLKKWYQGQNRSGMSSAGSPAAMHWPHGSAMPTGVSPQNADALADLADFYTFEDQYLPFEYFQALEPHIPG